MSDKDDIKALLQARAEALAAHLAPDGSRSGRYWIARNPTRDDRRAGSFYIWIAGPAAGAWRDDATGEKGDVLDLVAYVQGIDRAADFKGVLAWARGWLGLATMPDDTRRRAVAAVRAGQERAQARAGAEADERRKRAFGVYVASRQRPFADSPADLYLRSRGILVSALGRLPGCLGWLPDMRHAETGTRWPVMVAGFTGDDGRMVAVHRTFLDRDGTGKAPVAPVRKIWPSFGGAAIRLWRGESKMSIGEAEKCGLVEPLVLVEGVEDGLSVALACPKLRVWCAGSLGNLAQLRLPAGCEAAIVVADNDWGKPQAAALFEKAVRRLGQQAPVRVARSFIGKDVNDALKGAVG